MKKNGNNNQSHCTILAKPTAEEPDLWVDEILYFSNSYQVCDSLWHNDTDWSFITTRDNLPAAMRSIFLYNLNSDNRTNFVPTHTAFPYVI